MFGSAMGFASDSPATQGGSFGGAPGGDGARTGGRQEERMSCLPLTVRMVEDAIEKQRAMGAEELQIHGAELGQSSMMLFVGAVEQLVKQTSSVQFVLNDSTGRIRVRHYTTSEDGSKSIDQIVDGGYVTIAGSVRTSPSMHVSASFLHPVTSANEVSYHVIEAAYAGLKLKQEASGVKTLPTSLTTPTKSKTSPVEALAEDTPQKEAAPGVAAPVPQAVAPAFALPVAPVKAASPISTLLTEFIKREGEGKEAGLHVSAVCAGVEGEDSAIRAALEKLVEDGVLFTTIDDDHYAFL